MNARRERSCFGDRTMLKRNIVRLNCCPILPLLLYCMLILMISGGAAAGANTIEPSQISEPSFSLEARNEPLEQVLAQITQKTDYQFSLEDAWDDYPVTVTFRNLPLSQGLKRVLSRFNHAIVYESPNSIRIIIFGETVFQPAGSSPAPRPTPIPYQDDNDNDDDDNGTETETPESPETPSKRTDRDRKPRRPSPPENDDSERAEKNTVED